MTTKLAAALLALGDIPYDDAKGMSAAQVVSLYNFDHGILHGVEVNDAFWNLTPRLIVPHRRKSQQDTGIVAKVRRLEKDAVEFRDKVLARPCGQKRKRTSRMQSRPFPKRQRSFR